MKIQKNHFILLVAVALPLLYHGFNKLYYQFIMDSGLLNLLSQSAKDYVLANPLIWDSIFCFLMIVLATPIYLWMLKDKSQVIEPKLVTVFNGKAFWDSLVITFGVGGISALWNLAARYLITDTTITESVKSFDETFATAPSPSAYFWSFVSIALLGPIAEEIIFRGVLYSGLRRYLPGVMTAVLSGLYFGLWHSNPMQVVYTAVMGIVLGLVYYATGNFWFPMVIHLINNMLSTLPPALETDMVMMTLLVLKCVAIIPMAIIVYKMVRVRLTTTNDPVVSFRRKK